MSQGLASWCIPRNNKSRASSRDALLVEVETKNTRNEITTSVKWKTLLCMPAGMPRSTGVICATRGQTYTQNTDFTSPPFILTSGSHFRNDAILDIPDILQVFTLPGCARGPATQFFSHNGPPHRNPITHLSSGRTAECATLES